jgi:hypothetical protein
MENRITIQVGLNGTDFIEDCMSVIIKSETSKFLFTLKKNQSISSELFTRLLFYKAIKFYKQLFIKS